MRKLGIECCKIFVKTKTQLRLNPGFLVKDILDRFTAKIEKKLEPNRSLYIYSGHDTTIIGILSALGLYEVIIIFIPYITDTLSFSIMNNLTFFHLFH